MTSPVDLLAAIGTHLAEFALPAIASIHVATYIPDPRVTVQLSCHQPTMIAQGLLAWADTLTEITTDAWRVPEGDSVHLSVTGLLPGGAAIQVYGGLRIRDFSLGAGLKPGATTKVTLATLRHLAPPAEATEEVTLR